MVRHLFLLFASFSVIALAWAPAFAQSPCEVDERYSQYDFWVGDWDLVNAENDLGGRFKAEKIQNNCAIALEWRNIDGLTDRGIMFYDPDKDVWKQVWVGDQGGRWTSEETFADNTMMEETSRVSDDGKAILNRRVLKPLSEDRVVQRREKSLDKGETWKLVNEFFYIRVQPNHYSAYDRSATHPFGRSNPDAAEEARQFNFMVGEFTCLDESKNAEGEWVTSQTQWNSYYTLNGMAVKDDYRGAKFAGESIRAYDADQGKWFVTFFRMPSYFSAIWSGVKEGDDMVMRQKFTDREGRDGESKLIFYNIKADSFSWRSETHSGENINTNWKIACERRR